MESGQNRRLSDMGYGNHDEPMFINPATQVRSTPIETIKTRLDEDYEPPKQALAIQALSAAVEAEAPQPDVLDQLVEDGKLTFSN